MLKKTTIIILLTILTTSLPGASWNYDDIDSLINLSKNIPEDEQDAIYEEIGWRCRVSWPFLGIQYCSMAIEQAKKYDHPKILQKAYVAAGTNERNLDHFEDALMYYEMAMDVAKENNIRDQIAYGYNNLGNINIYLENYKIAEAQLNIALSFAEGLNDKQIEAYAYQNLGFLYKLMGRIESSIENSTKSYELWYELYMEKKNSIGRCLVPLRSIAECYIMEGEYQMAKDIYYRHINDTQTQTEVSTMADVWYRLTQIYFKQDMLDSAEMTGETSLMIAWQKDDYYTIKENYSLMDSILIKKGDYEKAARLNQELAHKNDSIFNSKINRQDEEIKYTSKYYIKENEFRQVKADRRFRILIIIASLIATIIAGIGLTLVLKKNKQISVLNQNLETERKKILESLKYTATLQKAVMPEMDKFGQVFKDKFLIYKPKDIVCGDFFWRFDDEDYEMIAVADCTGHGVPGAMLTMLGVTELQDIARSGVRKAGEVLELLRKKVKKITQQNKQTEISDGMDITLIIIDKKTLDLEYAGAFNPLVYIRNGELKELKATRNPIGAYIVELPFESKHLQLQEGDELYLLSDGYCSQFGGDDNSKFPKSKFRQIVKDNSQKPMMLQGMTLERELKKWQGSHEQVDDITVAGFRVETETKS